MHTHTYYHTASPHVVKPLFRATQVVWYVFFVIEALLTIRFLLRAFNANAAAQFTQTIYAISAPLVDPFASVFRVTAVEGATLEWTTLLAMLIYWLLAIGAVKLLEMGRPVSALEADERLSDADEE